MLYFLLQTEGCCFRCRWRISSVFPKYFLDKFIHKTLLRSCWRHTEGWYAFLCAEIQS